MYATLYTASPQPDAATTIPSLFDDAKEYTMF